MSDLDEARGDLKRLVIQGSPIIWSRTVEAILAKADAYALAAVESLPLPRYHHDAHRQRSREQKEQAQCLVCCVEALREKLGAGH